MIVFLTLACNTPEESYVVDIEVDSGLYPEASLSVIYEGFSLPSESSLLLTTAPAGLRYQHIFTFQLSNHSAEAIRIDCQQQWETEDLFIESCPEQIEPMTSASLQISFSPRSETEHNTLSIPLSFPENSYFLDLQLQIPAPLITLFWGDKGYLLRSIDYGHSIELIEQPSTHWAHSIHWGDGLFLRTSSRLFDWESDGIYEISQDGISWQTLQGTADISASDCSYGLNRFVCTRADVLSWTEDGQNIFHEQSMEALEHHDLTFAKERFVAVGRNGRRSVSYDGQTWAEESFHGLGDDYFDVIYGKDHFVAIGGKDRFLISWSSDGINWQDRMFPPTIGATLNSVVFDGDKFIISGSGTNGENILYTEDFQLWDPLRQSDPSLQMTILGYLNEYYIGVGIQNNQTGLYHSVDAMSWTLVHPIPSGINIAGYAVEGWFP